jgi:hypothetical protein
MDQPRGMIERLIVGGKGTVVSQPGMYRPVI